MSLGGEKCLWLCRLVDHRLRPFAEDGVVLESKEKEKELLIALSHVVTEIQRRVQEIDGDSVSEGIQMLISHEKSSDECDQSFGRHHCMAKIISELVLLLAFANQYVRHLVGNVLTAVTKFVFLTGSTRHWYELVHSLCFCMELVLARFISSPAPSITGCWHYSSFAKYLEILEARADTLHRKQGLKFLFLGHFVQFLCSLAEPSDFEEASGGSLTTHPLLGTIVNLIPNLFDWCLNYQVDHFDGCLSRYFSHKLLILMIRLSFSCHLQCSTLVLWLQLCRNRFQNLLLLPKLELESSSDTSLEDSPLTVSYFGEERSPCSMHLRRLAIFLFLRCSLSFICKQPTEKYDASIALKSQLMCTTNLESKCDGCNCSKKAILELYKWLQGNLPTNNFLDTKMYATNCIKFASSFLQLYMHELNYDHEMLLDYLMSKDSGTYCLEYLLRCLHIINDSRHAPEDLSTEWDVTTHSSCKRRKVLLDSSTIPDELLSSSPNQRNGTLLSSVDAKNCDYSYKPQRFWVKALKKSKNCLQSLKRSLENLHREDLFPYNPEVLIKRLTKFLELPME
ncbi:hypothetical protein SDJN03_30343, partial [Cucurbita argyrosperma subsp. sororia]